MTLVFTPLALTDLESILAFVAKDRPLVASAVLKRIRDRCELIATHPELGQLRPEFPGDVRSFPVQRWIIFYRITQSAVEVVRVLDGVRDLDSLL